MFSLNVFYNPRLKISLLHPPPTAGLLQQSTARTEARASGSSCDLQEKEKQFPFLSLPLELRMKIYCLILPSRIHKVVTNILYPQPYWNSNPNPLSNQGIDFTTYTVLNANLRIDSFSQRICPAILRTCKQINEEAEPILYGAETVFDFGIYIDAMIPFFRDRSAAARRAIRYVKVAREIPEISSVKVDTWDDARKFFDTFSGFVVDHLWSQTCAYVKDDCPGLRTVDLTVWSARGRLQDLLLPGEILDQRQSEVDPTTGEMLMQGEPLEVIDGTRLWREWEWTAGLLEAEALNNIKTTWWGFAANGVIEGRFDRWLVSKMMADGVTRHRKVHEGRVIEGVMVVPAKSSRGQR